MVESRYQRTPGWLRLGLHCPGVEDYTLGYGAISSNYTCLLDLQQGNLSGHGKPRARSAAAPLGADPSPLHLSVSLFYFPRRRRRCGRRALELMEHQHEQRTFDHF